MTRAERLAEQVRKAKEKLAAEQKRVGQLEAREREALRKDIQKRRYLVGALAHEAGLFAWDDVTLAGLFQALGRLRDAPEPVKVLESLLSDPITHAVGARDDDSCRTFS